MKIDPEEFRVKPLEKIDLGKRPTGHKPFHNSKGEYKKRLYEHLKEMKSLQRLLYASDRYSLLLIFQAMDAAGKDGAIRHVMSGINPQGCQVFSFKEPSAEERDHDFLWRTNCRLPERGRIGIFNRSYYEEVLVVRVHPEILEGQRLPECGANGRDIWQERFRSITEMEAHLHRNGTRIVKFFLHLSKDEQRKRFLKRIKDPDKNWKFSMGDVRERKSWEKYMTAYGECLSATSTAEAPWYIIPADDKHDARLAISQIILTTLGGLRMEYPRTDRARRDELAVIRKHLESGKE